MEKDGLDSVEYFDSEIIEQCDYTRWIKFVRFS